MGEARYAVRGRIAVVTLDNPPVNGLGLELRRGIVDCLERAAADATVEAVVLVGAGKGFSAGADIRELGTPAALAEPTLGTVIRTIEASRKPVLAAIHGVAMGGGLELALACHWRIADPDASVALPEVKLGILPGAGGTQRLPRVVGLERALDMITTGKAVQARDLASTALFDALVDRELVAGAVAFAEKALAEARPARLVRERAVEHPDPARFLARARENARAASRGLPAPLAIVDAMAAAATRPFEDGLGVERERFLQLVASREAAALRHAFFAERAAGRVPGVTDDTPARPLRSAAVIGAGTMGGGIAMALANAGVPVTLVEADRSALDRGVARIRKTYEASVAKGKLTSAGLAERMALVRPSLDFGDAAGADVAIEAVFEELPVKQGVFETLDAVMKPGAVLATNTSTLDVNRIARFTHRPGDVVGTHFFSPANVMRLLEIVRGDATAPDVVATALALAKRLGKVGVVAGVCDGFIGNRMLHQYQRQALYLVEEGALPQQVDRALEQWGMAMGPFRVGDLAGLDIGWAIRKRRYAEDPGFSYPRVADRVCELGRFGQKTGAGWYRYEPGKREAIPDPVVEELVVAHSKDLGLVRRAVSDAEIVDRCVLALVNEGARILEEGIALRASDVDLVYLTGYGFPAARGGPMFHADTVGLREVVRVVRGFAARAHGDRRFWEPAPLLARLAAENGSFNPPGRSS